MNTIWYLLKCPRGNERDYALRYREFAAEEEVQEVVCFEYQRMMRCGGRWQVERRTLLPGCIFLSGAGAIKWKTKDLFVIPCDPPYLRELCQEGNLVAMSKGIIRNGNTVVSSGPLKGRERLIRCIDRHKRTARIEIPFADQKIQVTVGLEIYEKQV